MRSLVVGLLVSASPAIAQQADPLDQMPGAAIYMQSCASCHGKDLRGGGASSLIDGAWQFGADRGTIRRNIEHGISAVGMPAYGKSLDRKQIDALLDYMAAVERESGTPLSRTLPEKLLARDYDVGVTEFATGLRIPWAMCWLDATTALVTERPGGLRLIVDGKLDPRPIANTPTVLHQGQGGLMDVNVDPDFKQNGWVYLAYSHSLGGEGREAVAMTRIVRGKIKDHAWTDEQVLWEAKPEHYLPTRHHYGSRIVFDGKGHLFFAIGDRGIQDMAQDLTRPNGKVHRIRTDGTVPTDNPFINDSRAYPSLYSYGHRNPQGLSIHPESGVPWEAEHGPMGGDELNVVKPGANYGWPVITYGINYSGSKITDETARAGMEQPAAYYVPSLALCGIEFYTGGMFPRWENNLLVTALAYEEVRRVVVDGDRVIHQELLLKNMGRVRDVSVAPGGAIYVVMNGPDRIVKLTSLGRTIRQ